MYKAAIFDNDGTLVDTHDIILSSMRYATKKVLGRDLSDALLMFDVGTPLDDQMYRISDGDQEIADELARVYRAHNKKEHDERIKCFDGIYEVLSTMHEKGMKTGVVTAKRHQLCFEGLQICKIDTYMDIIVGADDFEKHKPDPGPILYACSQLNVDPTQCLFVGDSPFDMQAGNAAGCTSVAALWGMYSTEKLAQCNPTYMFKEPLQLLDLIDG